MIVRWMIVGFVIWIAIAAAFRFVGENFFTMGPAGGVSWLFMTLPLLLLGLTYLMLKLLKVAPTDRAESGVDHGGPGPARRHL